MVGALITYWGQGDKRGAYKVLVGKPEGKNDFQDPAVVEKVILRWLVGWGGGGGAWTGLIWPRIWKVGGLLLTG